MPLLGDGSLELTQIDPGQAAWLAQVNANFLQVQGRGGWAFMGTSGEALTALNWVYINTSGGTLFKADWSAAATRLVVGVVLDSVATASQVRVHCSGIIDEDFGLSPGDRIFLGSSGAVSNSPADASDTAKMLVVGIVLAAGKSMIFPQVALSAF